jgi:hypothetical protein
MPQTQRYLFAVGVKIGRADRAKLLHQQHSAVYHTKSHGTHRFPSGIYSNGPYAFSDRSANSKERHAVIDFQVGKDIGLGMFGPTGRSVFSAGMRYANFTSSSAAT